MYNRVSFICKTKHGSLFIAWLIINMEYISKTNYEVLYIKLRK